MALVEIKSSILSAYLFSYLSFALSDLACMYDSPNSFLQLRQHFSSGRVNFSALLLFRNAAVAFCTSICRAQRDVHSKWIYIVNAPSV